MGIAEIGFYFLLEFWASFYLGIPSFEMLKFRKNFFLKIQILRCHKKCVGCFFVYLFLGGFFTLKSVKKCVCVLMLKIALLLVNNLCFGVKKGIS